MLRICVLAFWILSVNAASASQKETCFNRVTDDISVLSQQCFKLACKKGHVISDLIITSGSSGTRVTSFESLKEADCFGETAEFIHQSKDCFWKSSCFIQFPFGQMITSRKNMANFMLNEEQDSNIQCFSKHSKFACVLKVSCVKKKGIIDTSIEGRKDRITVTKKKKGIIRSHPTFPWYQSEVDVNFTTLAQINKPITKNLALAFYDLDIHDDSIITMTTAVRNVTVNNTHISIVTDSTEDMYQVSDVLEFGHKDKFITFEFKMAESTDDHLYRGFVICFKESKGKKKRKGRKKGKNRQKGKSRRNRSIRSSKNVKFCSKIMKKAVKIEAISTETEACKSSNYNQTVCCCNPTDRQTCENVITYSKAYNQQLQKIKDAN